MATVWQMPLTLTADDNDGLMDVTERTNWESEFSTATLKLLDYAYGTGAINVTRTYTSPTGGGFGGSVVEHVDRCRTRPRRRCNLLLRLAHWHD